MRRILHFRIFTLLFLPVFCGIVSGTEFRSNTYTSGNQEEPDIAMDNAGNFVIVWISNLQDGSGYGIYAQRYNPAGAAQGSEFRVNTYTANNQSYPSVAMDAVGNFVVCWGSSGQDGSGYGIYAQRYNTSGTAQGSEFAVNTYATNDQAYPAVAMDDAGNFVSVWESYGQDGSVRGIYAQRYNPAGAVQGGEFRVNTYTTGNQQKPDIAMDMDGDFVVVWASWGQDNATTEGIYAQRYNASGTAQGAEFRANTYTATDQSKPVVAMDDAGNFVITWHSMGQDGSSAGVFAQRYIASGTAQGGEFQANTYTTVDQWEPAIAMDASGNFIIAWHSWAQDGDRDGIYAQRYNPAGTPQGGEFRANTYTTWSQRFASMAMTGNCSYAVVWQSDGQDAAGWGIYADFPGCPLPLEWLAFSAQANNQSVILEWQTLSEKNCDHFDIERSYKGKDYAVVGTVQAGGTLTTPRSYQFTDNYLIPGAHYPVPNTIYYRLRQVDYDGSYNYSEIVSSDIPSDELSITGIHTTGGVLEVRFTLPFDNETGYDLFDGAGSRVLSGGFGHIQEGVHSASIPVHNLPSAVYCIILKSGPASVSERILLYYYFGH